MAKQKFDHLVNQSLMNLSREEEQEILKSTFQKFNEAPIPKYVDAYTWLDRQVLIQVFSYTPETNVSVQVSEQGHTSSDLNKRYFSVAKVLASGPESKYKAGDIVKLRDTDALSIESTKYKSWAENDYSKGNLKQKGEIPQRFISNIFKTLGPFAFILNPFDLEKLDSHTDDCIYKVTDAKIENPIANVDLLF